MKKLLFIIPVLTLLMIIFNVKSSETEVDKKIVVEKMSIEKPAKEDPAEIKQFSIIKMVKGKVYSAEFEVNTNSEADNRGFFFSYVDRVHRREKWAGVETAGLNLFEHKNFKVKVSAWISDDPNPNPKYKSRDYVTLQYEIQSPNKEIHEKSYKSSRARMLSDPTVDFSGMSGKTLEFGDELSVIFNGTTIEEKNFYKHYFRFEKDVETYKKSVRVTKLQPGWKWRYRTPFKYLYQQQRKRASK